MLTETRLWSETEYPPPIIRSIFGAYNDDMKPLSIGQLARSAGVPTSTLRYYERSGLLKPDERSGSNYRQYHPDTVEKLRFIRSAQAIGLSLIQVQELLDLTGSSGSPCHDVEQVLERRIAEVREKLRDLKRVERALVTARTTCCKGNNRGLCEAVELLRKPKNR